MIETQYKKLCEVCDNILLSAQSTIECISIPWLHIIREHSIFLKHYDGLFISEPPYKRRVKLAILQLKYIFGWILHLVRAISISDKMFTCSRKTPFHVDILFISHLLNSSQAGKEQDFYFDKVPQELNLKGYTSAIALINHSKDDEKTLAERWYNTDIPRVIFHNSLGFYQECKIFIRMFKEYRRLGRYSRKAKSDDLIEISARASIEALSGGARKNLSLYKQIVSLVQLLKPSIIIVTHEGHAWERIVFAAARESNPLIRCIGYQHSVLFRLQHAIRRNLLGKFNPDAILTAGMVGQVQLRKATNLNNIPISVLGSNRASPGALVNDGSSSNGIRFNQNPRPCCLVIPEGFPSESNLLFEFSLECGKLCPEIDFIWRLHPSIIFKTLIANNSNFRFLPPNIILSEETLELDIARCNWALYRGTTAIIAACSGGLRPIYLQLHSEMTIDPLYEMESWKVNVSKSQDFKRIITKDIEEDYLSSNLDSDSAKKYCDGVFIPFDSSQLEILLSDVKGYNK